MVDTSLCMSPQPQGVHGKRFRWGTETFREGDLTNQGMHISAHRDGRCEHFWKCEFSIIMNHVLYRSIREKPIVWACVLRDQGWTL